MEMPEELKKIAILVALGQIIKTLNNLSDDAENESPEIQAFVKKHTDGLLETDAKLQEMFGNDYMNVEYLFS